MTRGRLLRLLPGSGSAMATLQLPQAIAPARCTGYHQWLGGLFMRILSTDVNVARYRLPGTAPCNQVAVTPRKAGLAGTCTACVPATGIQHDRSCTGQGAQRALCCFRNVARGVGPARLATPVSLSTNQGRL